MSETRGTTLKILSLLLALQWGIVGIRNFVSCNHPISGSEYEYEQTMKIYCDCAHNKYGQFVADLVGAWAIGQALTRFHMATTGHVADLYLTLLFLFITDVLVIFAIFRLGWGEHPAFYNIMCIGSTIYEGITLVEARKAHAARLKMNKFK